MIALRFIFVILMGIGASFTMFLAFSVLVEILDDMIKEIKGD